MLGLCTTWGSAVDDDDVIVWGRLVDPGINITKPWYEHCLNVGMALPGP